MRHSVLLAVGKYVDEKAGFSSQEGPRLEFAEIAKFLNADIHSYVSGAAERGSWFKWMFRSRKLWGSALNIALYRNRYDRLYATGEDIGFRAALLLKLLGWKGKMVCLVHNMSRSRKWLLRLIGHQLFNSLVVVSKSQIPAIVTLGFPERKVTHVFNWVDDEFFAPLDDVHSGTGRITFVACGAENRDYETLRLATELSPGQTYVFGHGFFGAAKQLASQEDGTGFIPMPRVDFEVLRRYYGSATAIVVPLNAVEYAAGVTGLVEAMSMGRPVIVTRSPGIKEYCCSVHGGLLVPPRDHVQLSKAMQLVASDPEALSKHGKSNREWILRNCSLNGYVKTIASLMERSTIGDRQL
jgi:glycosyltransferase involved in cell wall biosynthesis